jgi:hypothetical protein
MSALQKRRAFGQTRKQKNMTSSPLSLSIGGDFYECFAILGEENLECSPLGKSYKKARSFSPVYELFH